VSEIDCTDESFQKRAMDSALSAYCWLGQKLALPVDNSTLAAFRIAFGFLIGFELLTGTSTRIEILSERPIRFPYDGFGWVQPLPNDIAVGLHVAMVVACFAVAIGLVYRCSSIFLAASYTYSFLIDRAYFNNHFYLICLLAWWLSISQANHRWSLDAALGRVVSTKHVPRWQTLGIGLQLSMPYFFGGLVKINPDWLGGDPMRALLWGLWDNPVYGNLVRHSWAPVAFAWSGMIFDLFVVPAILWRRTRLAGISVMILFHLTNMQMLQIGIFPWIGIASTVIFLPPDCITRTIQSFSRREMPSSVCAVKPVTDNTLQPAIALALSIWFLLQVLVPLRHYLIPGNVGWTREGFYFAWTMKLNLKSTFLGFHVCDIDTGRCLSVDHTQDLTDVQRIWLPGEPRGIVHYAQFLRSRVESAGLADPVIVCDSVVAMNGRPYQYMLDPSRDPATLRPTFFGHADWIMPLNQSGRPGMYLNPAQKERAVMTLIRRTRIKQGIFPGRLAGLELRDVTKNYDATAP
jgi:vitamin K-dependent gamma-carboxylase